MNDDRWLEELLAEPAPHLDDDGFTARVVARLPRPALVRERHLILGIATLLAALVVVLTPAGAGVGAAFELVGQVIAGRAPSSPSAGLPLAALISGGVLLLLSMWGAVALARAQET